MTDHARRPVTVFDLATGEYAATYQSISPTDAVVAAHAQSLGDWNTWEYATRYADQVVTNLRTVRCGDFTTSVEELRPDDGGAIGWLRRRGRRPRPVQLVRTRGGRNGGGTL